MRLGGRQDDYLEVHRWFDATKVNLVHFTHRALRHHAQGIRECVATFGATITRPSDGVQVDVADLGRQHCEEDCGGRVPEASHWLAKFKVPDWLPHRHQIPDASELAEASARRFGGYPGLYLPLHEWFLETLSWWDQDDARGLSMRHHAFGIFEAETRFGVLMEVGEGIRIPTRYLGERHVRAVLKRVPPAADWLRKIEGESWMSDAAPRPGKQPRGSHSPSDEQP